jgi:hypothetical protein
MIECPDITIEKEFSKMLVKINNYSINGNNLSLNGSEMATLARFEAMK